MLGECGYLAIRASTPPTAHNAKAISPKAAILTSPQTSRLHFGVGALSMRFARCVLLFRDKRCRNRDSHWSVKRQPDLPKQHQRRQKGQSDNRELLT